MHLPQTSHASSQTVEGTEAVTDVESKHSELEQD
jgi:hypothetical protein